jgi:peptidoglycan/xylan/chitin deacetylase (PgdA/CDA1 family)
VRRTRNRLRRTSVILLYHRVATGIPDPWSLCVSPASFREQMAVLAARGVSSLDGLVDGLAADRRRATVVVTFDDGYADFHTAALPVLRAHGIPATLFVTTGSLADGREFWWDALERIVLASPALPDRLELELGTERFGWRRGPDGDRRPLYHALHQRLGRLPGPARSCALEALGAWAGQVPGCRPTHRPLDEAELRAVGREPGIAIGAHTVSHSYLPALPEDEQTHEIRHSKRALETLTGRPVEHFSYPHGDYEAGTVARVRGAGFRAACASACAPITDGVDPFALPRVEVPNFPGAAFARWLDEWVG